MATPAIDQAFNVFSSTLDPRERQKALSSLMTLKAVPKHADDPRFELGLERWSLLISNKTSSDEHRLLAIAELIRAGQMVKKLQARIRHIIEPTFASPIPSCRLLKDADDRLNVARACSMMNADWLPIYLAQAIAEEEAGEKARTELMAALMQRVSSVSQALGLMAESFLTVRSETESPGESMAKRLTRTLAAFRSQLLISLVEAGEDVGKRLDGMIRDALRNSGRPQEEKTQLELTREIVLTLHDLVRTRFSVSTEAETFSALKLCRSFFTGISWPRDLSNTMELLIQDVSEALVLLGRQDVPNQGLLDQLELVCGVKERARYVANSIADKHTELPERIRDWLKRGRLVNKISSSEALETSILESIDASIGLALIEARLLKDQDDLVQQIVSTLEIYDSSVASSARAHNCKVKAAISAFAEVAKRRGIELFGSVGEEIDFAPKYFDSLGAVAGRRVIVRRPAVVISTSQGMPAEAVLKGIVE
jgi:hypothetical protein